MPLPILNHADFSRTDTFLGIPDYFNPRLNTNYYDSLQTRASSGAISLAEIETIAKNILTPESLITILPWVARQFSGGVHEDFLTLLRMVYDLLPDEQKWMVMFTRIKSRTIRASEPKYAVQFRHFSEVAYYETVVETTDINIDLGHYSYGNFPTEAAIAAFKEELASLNIWDKFHSWFATAPMSPVTLNDTNIPGIITLIYRYASGFSAFYPNGDPNNFAMPFDWATAKAIRRAMDDGINVSISITNTGGKLNFTARPAPGDRRNLERILNYSANVMNYLPYTIQGEKEPKAVLFGVELEANGDYQPKELIAAQKDLFFIMKQDSSVYGSKQYNYELVTVPASLKAHKRLWAEFFEKIDYQNFDTTKETGNGMHVHIDRKAFKPSHLNRFTWFITNPSNEDFILCVSERPTKRNLEEWARMPNYVGQPTRVSASRSAVAANRGIRGAVHYKSDKTVEIRLFKGIVSYATIVKNLEFVDSVFHFTLVTSLAQLSLRNYIDWLNSTPVNKYQMLKAFLAEVKLQDILAGAEVGDYIWTLRTEHIVAEKLNKAPFKVTNAHITYLNKKRRKRTFILKNGEVQCVASSGGLLAKLDKSIQKKQTRGAATFSMSNFAA